jgi:COP9 signalosome complex subunit 7
MELGSHLSTKLEPFVLNAKSAKGAGAAKLILDAVSAQGVYFFAELLDAPNIQEVRLSTIQVTSRFGLMLLSFSASE